MRDTFYRLEKEESHAILDKLKSDERAVVFSKEFTQVSYKNFSFYNNFKLYRFVNYATLPSFVMEYLGDGDVFVALDGTANPIYAVNAEAPVNLTDDNVIEYLDFFFEHIHGSEGDIYLIKTAKDIPSLASLDEAQRQTVIDAYVELEKLPHQENSEFKVRATVYYAGSLLSAVINVNSNGRISFSSRQMLLKGIVLPKNEVNYYWMGER